MKKQRRQFAVGNPFDEEDKNEFHFEPQTNLTPSNPPQVVSKSNKDLLWMINYQITVVKESEVPQKQATVKNLEYQLVPQPQPQRRYQKEEVFGISPQEQQSKTELYVSALGINQSDLLLQAKSDQKFPQLFISKIFLLFFFFFLLILIVSNNSEQIPDQANLQSEEQTIMNTQQINNEPHQINIQQNKPMQTTTNTFSQPSVDKNQQVKEDAMTRTHKLLQQSQQLLQKSRLAQQTIKEPVQQPQSQQNTQQLQQEIQKTHLIQKAQPQVLSPQTKVLTQQLQAPQQQQQPSLLMPVQKQTSPILNDIQSVQTSQSPSTTQLSPQVQQVLSPPPVQIPSSQQNQVQQQPHPIINSPEIEKPNVLPEIQKQQKSNENDFEFQFILKALSKQQRIDHIQTLIRQWQNIQSKSQDVELLLVLSEIMQRLLFNLGSSFLDGNMQDSQKHLLNLLNTMVETEFQNSYNQIFEQNQNNWETVLLINLGYTQDEIRIDNQEIILKYLKSRSYSNDKEVLVLLLASLIKMEQSDLKQKEFQMIFTALLSESQSYSSFFQKILWLGLKMFPRFMNQKNFKFLFDLFLKDQMYADSQHYFISLLILSSLSDQFPINQLIHHANTFNNLGFLESLAIRFDVQLPGEFYYLIAQHCVNKQKPKIALEFLKVALELGYFQAKELRDQLINEIYQQKDVKEPQPQQQSGGFFGQFKQVIQKTIAQPIKPKQEEKEPKFYYDSNLKTWIIDGKVAENEEEPKGGKAEVNQATLPPPPQKNVLPPSQQAPRITQAQDQVNLLSKNTPLSANPFSSPEQQSNADQKIKRNRLMGNRYVQ